MTQSSRTVLARFFKVHPGFLVDDPRAITRNWFPTCGPPKGSSMCGCCKVRSVSPAIRQVSEVLIKVARDKDTRRCLLLLGEILNTPGLADRLFEALRPEPGRGTRACASTTQDKAKFMTWADFYLICFAIGFLLSAISFIAGGLRWHLHLPHFPHFGGGHGGAGHAPVDPERARLAATHGTHAGHQRAGVAVQLRDHDGVSRLVRRHRDF
jgi:hypothetical protein